MTARDLVYRTEYTVYQVVAGITQRLPLTLVRAWARVVGRVAYLLLSRRRALTIDNLAHALPELDESERRQVARRCFEVQSATYHEQVWAMRRGAEIADRFEVVGREHFDAARAHGRGLLVLTGHYGCWEVAAYPLGRWLGKVHIVARPQNNPLIAAHFEQLRESNGNVQIDRGRAGTRMLMVLRKGGAVGLALDQRVRPQHGLLVPFLGRYAWTSRLPAQLATVTGCAALPLVCVPLADGRYRITFDPPILPEGEGDDEIERLTRRYAAALEPHIRAQPELWLWMHSRWQRTRKQRRPEAIAKLVAEAGLPAVAPLRDAARRAPASASLARLAELPSDDFVESARHLFLVGSNGVADGGTAAFAAAVSRLGHATRYVTLRSLCDRLAAAAAADRLESELRELDRISLIAIAGADAAGLDTDAIELYARFLRHRLDRGSTVTAGIDANAWRQAAGTDANVRATIEAHLSSCEVIDLSSVDPRVFAATVADSTAPSSSSGETETPALRA
jgi:KDO2-lipid IV(A) lauroyltransferase